MKVLQRRLLLTGLLLALGLGCSKETPPPLNDPTMAKETGATINGSVTVDGVPLKGGYVVAWQGVPIQTAEINSNGEFKMLNSPMGKVHLTVTGVPPQINTKMTGGPGGPGGPPGGGPAGGGPPGGGPAGPPGGGPGGPPGPGMGGIPGGPPGVGMMGGPIGGPGGPKGGPPGGMIGGPGGPAILPVPVPQNLEPEVKALVDKAQKKYGDPSKNLIQVEIVKGQNTQHLVLTTGE